METSKILKKERSGAFAWEIVPVTISGGRGKPIVIIDSDEGLRKFDSEKLRKLRPSFKEKGGSVTAGNASTIRKQRETGASIVTGTRYVKGGGVHGWNLMRKLTSNFIASNVMHA
ncbi:acetyl-CoA C-acetyltransferase [Sarracenia purpurea var. burkii]